MQIPMQARVGSAPMSLPGKRRRDFALPDLEHRLGVRTLFRRIARLDHVVVMVLMLQWIVTIVFAYIALRFRAMHASAVSEAVYVAATLCVLVACFLLVRTVSRKRDSHSSADLLLGPIHGDELTGLPNRAAMQQHLTSLLRSAAQADHAMHCFYLDLDGLRQANRLLGYRTGDSLLQQIVARVANCLNPADYLARMGGDKFVILVHRALSRSAITELAECIVHTVAQPHRIADRELTLNVSIGIASFPHQAASAESLLAAAERAMYMVKRSGRNNFCHAEQTTNIIESRSSILADRLQRALLHEQLHLVYQPIFDAHGRIVAAEALARWQDAEHGSISPGEFIPIAEETGLIIPLSTWVLRRACHQMCLWRKAGAGIQRIAVNVSILQVCRPDFVNGVQAVLRETGLPPECLELEVTESAIARDFEAVKDHLQDLRILGIRISIDDFGTGYSSFGRLRELNADTLKIDRLFVQGAHDTKNGAIVLQALIQMAHTLNLSVVAEGVETREQMEMLRDLQCDDMQGFLLGRPQDPEHLHKLLLDLGQLKATAAVTGVSACMLPSLA